MLVKVRALIWHERHLLVHREMRRGEVHVSLPGGRVLDREALADALRREVTEELGLDVQVGALRYVAQVVQGHMIHDLNLVFDATVDGDLSPEGRHLVDPDEPDAMTVLPPILDVVAADRGTGVRAPRWLGNVWHGAA